MTASVYRDRTRGTNWGWVRRDSWLPPRTLNAPAQKGTYDMGGPPMGVGRVGPFGTKPMAIGDGNAIATQPLDVPTAPMGTAMTLLILGIVIAAALWILKPRKA